ncbi:MAG: hypothetical protein R3E32_01400 [Chitinophagales bacterium]
MNFSKPSLPLYDFFLALRKNGFSLGIAEYNALMDALQGGFGMNKEMGLAEENRLFRLCKLLWLKPNQSEFVFKSLFEDKFKKTKWENKNLKEEDAKQEEKDVENSNNEPDFNDPQLNENTLSEEENKAQNQLNNLPKTSLVKYVLGSGDGESIQLSTSQKPKKKFFFSNNYFDISKRQMLQVCRFLPLKQASINQQEIDIEASIQAFAEKGVGFQPVFQKKERVVNNVLLLIDNGGSMIAFEQLAETFATALKDAFQTHKEANKQQIAQYYFYNIPEEYVYKNTAHTAYDKTDDIIDNFLSIYSSVIIISDAGAARGGNSTARFKKTLRFILQIKKVTEKIVWLNPMPEKRWVGTTAERIARLIPMFGLDTQHNLQTAINTLRGK